MNRCTSEYRLTRYVLIAFLLWLVFVWLIGYLPQLRAGQEPAGIMAPIPLTELEKAKQENIKLRLQILQRDQQEFLSQCIQAHKVDIAKYRYDIDAETFFPYPAPAAAVKPAPAPAKPPQKK